MKLLVDTNVYLELFLKRERSDEVVTFFHLAMINQNQTFITPMSVRDIGYVVQRFTHSNEIAKRMQMKAYCMTSKMVSISACTGIEALYSDMKDYEDALQSLAAEESMCDAIITFNKKDYYKSRLPAISPDEINKIWIKQKAENNN